MTYDVISHSLKRMAAQCHTPTWLELWQPSLETAVSEIHSPGVIEVTATHSAWHLLKLYHLSRK